MLIGLDSAAKGSKAGLKKCGLYLKKTQALHKKRAHLSGG
jgi:hypothetical protein